ncbi:MAG: gamma carbonic anhydrase family protein [Alphaproteobacteria bacterium]
MIFKPQIYPYLEKTPLIPKDCFIAPNAIIVGDVKIGSHSSIWFNSTIRGDVASITIGDKTNIQDGSVIHVCRNDGPTIIGSEVTIGHKVLVHACTIQDRAFIGMGSILMDKVIVETNAMVAAGSLVTPGKIIRSGELWAGSPAKFFRKLTEEEIKYFSVSAENYAMHAKEYIDMFSIS